MQRKKIISIRVNEELYNEFLQVIEKFTDTYTLYFPSRTENHHYTHFPDRPYRGRGKYTLADFLEENMREFVKKYKTDV